MSSSTSSFRTELRVLAVVLFVLLAAEVAVRFGERSLSRDVQHIQQIPAISQSLAASKDQKILFLGNSLVRTGVDPQIIEQELKAKGVAPVHIERVFPDSTSLPDWYRVFKHYFVNQSSLPQVLVLCFSDIALQDTSGIDPTRLGRYYSSATEVPEIFHQDIHDFESRSEFVLAATSYAFANRMRVRTRALDLIVPAYRTSAQRINDDMKQKAPAVTRPKTYERLARLLELARQEGVQVVVVAMPQPVQYSLDPEITRVVDQAGMTLLDCRSVNGINAQSFLDEMHLADAGAIVYSHFLGKVLAEPIARARTRENLLSAK